MSQKAEVRATTDELVAQYLEKGGRVTVDRPFQSGNGYTAKDWARIQKGEKVATGAEIAAERDRRALKAIRNKDIALVARLLAYEFDKVIKFDIEAGRIGPNGEMR